MELFQSREIKSSNMYSSQTKLINEEIQSISDDTRVDTKKRSTKKARRKQSKSKNDDEDIEKKISFEYENNSYQRTENESHSERKHESSASSILEDNINNVDNGINMVEKVQIDYIEQSETSHSSSNSRNIRNKKRKVKKEESHRSNTQSPSKSVSVDIEMQMTTLKAHQENLENIHFKIIGIYIHKTNKLNKHPFLNACEVRIHVYDFETGECLNNDTKNNRKSDIHTCLWESIHSSYLEPHWNQLLIFENFLIEAIGNKNKSIILLELCKIAKFPGDSIVAWSFVLLSNENKTRYLNKKIKLQMYEPLKDGNVYDCWKRKPWKLYPSAIHITIKGYNDTLNQDDDIINTVEYSTCSLIRRNRENIEIKIKNQLSSDNDENIFIKRKDKEKCKVFNSIVSDGQFHGKSCFIMKFSNCGKYLAFPLKLDDSFPILIVTIPDFKEVTKLKKHKDMVYDLSWNSTSNLMISASSDSTVCIWEICGVKFSLMQELQHDTFVYCAQFCESSPNIIATGSFDKIVRVWLFNEEKQFNLHQKLIAHNGFVTSICFGKKSKAFYSGDSLGLIIKWSYENDKWEKLLLIKCSEIQGNIINDLKIFPNNQKLLIVLRNSISWVMDTATSTLMLCYREGIDYRYQLRGCITPCGSFVIVGNCIWTATTGLLLGIYNPVTFNYQTVTAVDYHPFYNMVSIACGFSDNPILICANQRNKHNEDKLNMEMFTYEEERIKEELAVGANDKLSNEANRTFSFKQISQTIANFQSRGEDSSMIENEKIQSFKLLELINKMDKVILNVKKEPKGGHGQSSEVKINIRNSDVKKSEEQEELKLDIESEMSDATYTVDHNNSTLSEAESIHTYTVSPSPNYEIRYRK